MGLYVIRYGQTDANLNRIIAGITDVSLNETGLLQAKEAGEKLKDIKFDVIFCSPLTRTKMTCENVNINNFPVIFDNRIVERNAGIFEGKSSSLFNLDEYWNYNLKINYEKAESIDNLFSRVGSFIDMLKKEYKDKNILVVTHYGVCRTIACFFNGVPEDGNIRVYSHKNCEVKKYEL